MNVHTLLRYILVFISLLFCVYIVSSIYSNKNVTTSDAIAILAILISMIFAFPSRVNTDKEYIKNQYTYIYAPLYNLLKSYDISTREIVPEGHARQFRISSKKPRPSKIALQRIKLFFSRKRTYRTNDSVAEGMITTINRRDGLPTEEMMGIIKRNLGYADGWLVSSIKAAHHSRITYFQNDYVLTKQECTLYQDICDRYWHLKKTLSL